MQYIKEYKKTFYNNLLISGKLNEYLADIDEQAEEMFMQVLKQTAEREDVTEQLKAENQLLWVQKMNSIRSRAMEVMEGKVIFDLEYTI